MAAFPGWVVKTFYKPPSNKVHKTTKSVEINYDLFCDIVYGLHNIYVNNTYIEDGYVETKLKNNINNWFTDLKEH